MATLPREIERGQTHEFTASGFGPTNPYYGDPIVLVGRKRILVALEEIDIPTSGVCTFNMEWNATREPDAARWQVSNGSFRPVSKVTSAVLASCVANGGIGMIDGSGHGYYTSIPVLGPVCRVRLSGFNGGSTAYSVRVLVTVIG